MNIALINPQLWASCLLISALAFGGGYLKGVYSEKRECENEQLKVENEARKEIKQIELKSSVDLSAIGKTYAEQKKENIAAFDAVVSNFNGLCVKSNCVNAPTVAAPGSRIDAAGNTDRQQPSETDFAELAEQIAKLGFDYDNAALKINKLQEVINVYQNACGIIKP